MGTHVEPWDYLVVTASNDEQAAAYETQLRVRREPGLLSRVGKVLMADAMSRKGLAGFERALAGAWELQKGITGSSSTNPEIEALPPQPGATCV